MKLIRDADFHLPASVVTIGNFDGVHAGHQQLINTLQQHAAALQLPAVVLTFHPHPSEFFSPDNAAARLMRFSEKWRVLAAQHIDYCYVMRFHTLLADVSAEDFVKTILVKQLGAKQVIVGDDFRFGAKRLGDVTLLKKLGLQAGFDVEALPQRLYQQERISSSRIRAALKAGDFELAKALLGRPFTLSGKVAYGSQMGRTLGFPTANIYLRRKHVPLQGIFAVRVQGLSSAALPGVASLGYRPTFHGKTILLEVHLFDFNQTIYGRHLTVEFLRKIRDEIKFDSVAALIEAMQQDSAVARRVVAIT